MPSADDASSSALSDAGTPRALPAPPPLSHADPHLQAAVFSPSAFLLSRTPGMSLSEISASLAAYAGALRAELASVVDRDFRAFVALAGALSAEKARIARLGWRDEEQEGGLRVGEVRELVARAKDDLEDVRHEVQAVMREREQVAEQQVRSSGRGHALPWGCRTPSWGTLCPGTVGGSKSRACCQQSVSADEQPADAGSSHTGPALAPALAARLAGASRGPAPSALELGARGQHCHRVVLGRAA
jgi:hypothetical protein